jgi:hypothetical protein
VLLHLRTDALAWLVGVQCALLGALMLLAPQQFAGGLYVPLQPHLTTWGSVLLLTGVGIVGLTAVTVTRAVRVAPHLVAGGCCCECRQSRQLPMSS